ncbi:MAG TPA: four helix bundle protein [Tepidisphaeraceae bacterium]|nr:four helix bundle protein [Tepidisphaeraceae bacterium]
MTPAELEERTFQFGVRVVKLAMHLARRRGISFRLIDQLVGAGTSVGANVEESHAAVSKPDFLNKRGIALKECRESVYFLRVLEASGAATRTMVGTLVAEGREIGKILAKGIITTKRSLGITD